MNAVLSVSDENSWCGKRDRVLFTVMYNTGARVSEIIDLNVSDVMLESNGTIRLFGKGRKERVLPLWKSTVALLRRWIKGNQFSPKSPLFPTRKGFKMTRSAVAKRLEANASEARKKCHALKTKRISPHTIRHSTAMRFLQSGVDITVIAMWLGHEHIATTHLYVTADMQMKQKALDAIQEPSGKKIRFQADDALLEYLDNL